MPYSRDHFIVGTGDWSRLSDEEKVTRIVGFVKEKFGDEELEIARSLDNLDMERDEIENERKNNWRREKKKERTDQATQEDIKKIDERIKQTDGHLKELYRNELLSIAKILRNDSLIRVAASRFGVADEDFEARLTALNDSAKKSSEEEKKEEEKSLSSEQMRGEAPPGTVAQNTHGTSFSSTQREGKTT